MGVVRCVAACGLVAALSATTRGQTVDARAILVAARQALGGDKTLSAVRTFVASGRTRQIRGNNLVPIEFEISCELPHSFVRKDEVPAQDSDITVSGFRGDALIQFPTPVAPPRAVGPEASAGRGGPAITPAQQRLAALKQDFARLTLGVFAASFPSFPLTFTYAAEGEAPEGKADVLNVTGPGTFAARLVIARATHLPVMLVWQAPATIAASRGTGSLPSTGPTPVESRLYYGDYRDVNGVKWPFRIRRAIGNDTIEETIFDRVRINVTIDPKKFEAPK
jgi:hypothetical protein